jgi:hypothetical protein
MQGGSIVGWHGQRNWSRPMRRSLNRRVVAAIAVTLEIIALVILQVIQLRPKVESRI